MITKKIQINIDEETKYGKFSDSMYFTEEEFNELSEKEVNSRIEERLIKWIDFMDNKPEDLGPTVEQLITHKEKLQALIDEAEGRIQEKINASIED